MGAFPRNHRRAILLLGALWCVVAGPTSAAAQASAYVPLDDIAYTYIDALMARGMFTDLSMLERPFTQRALRVAIDSARTREPEPVVASFLDALYKSVEVRVRPAILISGRATSARGALESLHKRTT